MEINNGDIERIVREVTINIAQKIQQEEARDLSAFRRTSYEVPNTQFDGRRHRSAYDLGPCAEEMRRMTAGRDFSNFGKCSSTSRSRGSAYDLGTRP